MKGYEMNTDQATKLRKRINDLPARQARITLLALVQLISNQNDEKIDYQEIHECLKIGESF